MIVCILILIFVCEEVWQKLDVNVVVVDTCKNVEWISFLFDGIGNSGLKINFFCYFLNINFVLNVLVYVYNSNGIIGYEQSF